MSRCDERLKARVERLFVCLFAAGIKKGESRGVKMSRVYCPFSFFTFGKSWFRFWDCVVGGRIQVQGQSNQQEDGT
jgi:hypothetical protein